MNLININKSGLIEINGKIFDIDDVVENNLNLQFDCNHYSGLDRRRQKRCKGRFELQIKWLGDLTEIEL